MKTSPKLFLTLSIAALGCVLFSNNAIPAGQGEAYLTIKRSADFGKNLFLDIWIDGKRVQRLGRGQVYQGALSAGTHEVRAATASGSEWTVTQLTVAPGRSYQLTASFQAQRLVLR
jgi:hypothetical protein